MDEYTLEDVSLMLGAMVEEMEIANRPNSWNQSVGDELHQIEYQLGRIADSLDKIANK